MKKRRRSKEKIIKTKDIKLKKSVDELKKRITDAINQYLEENEKKKSKIDETKKLKYEKIESEKKLLFSLDATV